MGFLPYFSTFEMTGSCAPEFRAADRVSDCNHFGLLINCRYGVSRQNERFNAEIKDLYAGYVSGILPPGNEDLKGDEYEKIIEFKNALGLDDPDAAAMHVEVPFTFLVYSQFVSSFRKLFAMRNLFKPYYSGLLFSA